MFIGRGVAAGQSFRWGLFTVTDEFPATRRGPRLDADIADIPGAAKPQPNPDYDSHFDVWSPGFSLAWAQLSQPKGWTPNTRPEILEKTVP
jgi:hypothetical protein